MSSASVQFNQAEMGVFSGEAVVRRKNEPIASSFCMARSHRSHNQSAVRSPRPLGLGLSHNYLLQGPRGTSGRAYSTSVNVLGMGTQRFLVAPRVETEWVRNGATLFSGACRFAAGGILQSRSNVSRLRVAISRYKDRVRPSAITRAIEAIHG